MTRRLRTRVQGLTREGGWALVDQMISSGTNFVPALVLARLLGPDDFGTFSLTFLAWFLTLSVIRSTFMVPYTLAASSLDEDEWRDLTSRASGLVLVAAIVAGVLFSIAGVVVGWSSDLGRTLIAVAVLAPGLALQEFWRVAAYAARRARTAAANDGLWALGQAVAFGVILLTAEMTPASALVAWGAGAVLAACLGTVQLSVRPHIDRATLGLARHWMRIGAWFTGANATFAAGLFVVAGIVAATAGSDDLGLFRVVQANLFGPVQLVIIAAESVFLPHVVRSIRLANTTGVDAAKRYSAALTVAVAAYGAVLLLVASFVLEHVFGSAYASAEVLVLPMLIAFMLDASGDGAGVLLRARARGRSLLAMQIAATGTRVLAVYALTQAYGVVGAAWGLVIGSAVAASCSWALVLGETRWRPGARLRDISISSPSSRRPAVAAGQEQVRTGK